MPNGQWCVRLTQNTHAVRTAGEEGRHRVPVVSGPSTASPAGTTSHRSRTRVAARTRLDFWFDGVILVGYTVACSYGFTGVVIHEWLGIALLLHLTAATPNPLIRSDTRATLGIPDSVSECPR